MTQQEEQLIADFQSELDTLQPLMIEVTKEILANDISNYPIFVAHQAPVELGKLVVHGPEVDCKWSISASHLEDFANQGVIEPEKVDEFIEAYHDPYEYLCVFLLHDDFGNILFIPMN